MVGDQVTILTCRPGRRATKLIAADGIEPYDAGGIYHETAAGIVHVSVRKGEAFTVLLTNFLCRIERQQLLDDGGGQQRRYALCAELGGERRRFEIGADEFRALNWVERYIGADALIHPVPAARELVPHALKALSRPVAETTIFGHVGWRKLGGVWVYLHSGGALGAAGPVDGITCSPGFGQKARLNAFCLPPPVNGHQLRAGCRALARMLAVFPSHPGIGLSLLSAGLRAPFGHANFMLSLVGSTGGGKSSVAALAQNMFAPTLDGAALPLSWQDTPTTIESVLYWLRDALVTIDDLAPQGTRREQGHSDLTFARVSRAIGNHSSRGRSNADLSARPDRPPMGVAVSTVEFMPPIASQIARGVQVDVPSRSFDSGILSLAQAEAFARAEAMATLLSRMACDLERWRARFAEVRDELRTDARPKLAQVHPRCPDNVADLGAGLRCALELLPELGELVAFDSSWQMLLKLGEAQRAHVSAGDQALRFLEYIRGAIASRAAHLSPARHPADQPDENEADALGWLRVADAFTSYREPDQSRPAKFRPSGPRVGWLGDDDVVFLEPTAAYALAEQQAAKSGASLGLGERALWRLLAERGLLARQTKGRNAYRAAIGDTHHWVVCVPAYPCSASARPSATARPLRRRRRAARRAPATSRAVRSAPS